MGIIDILTEYNVKKKLEHGIKSMQYDAVRARRLPRAAGRACLTRRAARDIGRQCHRVRRAVQGIPLPGRGVIGNKARCHALSRRLSPRARRAESAVMGQTGRVAPNDRSRTMEHAVIASPRDVLAVFVLDYLKVAAAAAVGGDGKRLYSGGICSARRRPCRARLPSSRRGCSPTWVRRAPALGHRADRERRSRGVGERVDVQRGRIRRRQRRRRGAGLPRRVVRR
jgi:hypothetical protein